MMISALLRLLGIAALALPVLSTLTLGATAATERPNVVLIMTDDQGYGDLGVHGNPILETPNLDAMASRSAQLGNFYVCPVCAPTRACLLTGRYNYRTRAIDTYVGRAMMEPDEVTLAEILREAGYATGIFGKWHLGDCYPLRPQDQGFDEVLVHRGGGIGQPSDPLGAEGNYTNAVLQHNGKQVQTEGYCTDVYFTRGIEWLRERHQAGQPFFVYLPTNAPHGPYHDVPTELYEKYKQRDLSPVLLGNERTADTVARIFAMIENVDQNVGRLFNALEELALTDKTIVLFLCDNGPNTRRYVAGLRGMKGTVYEGGIRSPLLVHWPAQLKPAVRSDHRAAHIDLAPTLLEMTGVAPPEQLRLDGLSLLPLLRGDDVQWPERSLVLQWHRGNIPEPLRHCAVVGERWKLVGTGPVQQRREGERSEPRLELYDLENDPQEAHDVASQHPEQVRRLKRAYEKWFADVSTTRPDNFAPPRIVLGNDAERQTVLTKQDWRRERGGGWGHQGHWLVRVEHRGPYQVRVVTKEPLPEGATVILQAGESMYREQKANTSETRFENLRLPLGELRIRAEIQANDPTLGVHQVIVERN